MGLPDAMATRSYRIAMQVSTSSPLKFHRPTAPAYTPRFSPSRPAINCMARIFGAPLTVPAGMMLRKASHRVLEERRRPEICEVRCMTWLKRSTAMKLSILTVAGSQTLLTSLRARSTSLREHER